jgi:hypothetical protein
MGANLHWEKQLVLEGTQLGISAMFGLRGCYDEVRLMFSLFFIFFELSTSFSMILTLFLSWTFFTVGDVQSLADCTGNDSDRLAHTQTWSQHKD